MPEDASDAPITQIVRFKLKAGEEEPALALLAQFVVDTQREEPGVLVYLVHHPKDDPSEVVLFEVYRDEAAYETHRTAPHWLSISTRFMDAVAAPMDVLMLDRISGFTR